MQDHYGQLLTLYRLLHYCILSLVTIKKTDEFKESIRTFVDNMGGIPDWYDIIQKRGNGHVMMSSMGIKVDDYEYWANAHKEEYLMKSLALAKDLISNDVCQLAITSIPHEN